MSLTWQCTPLIKTVLLFGVYVYFTAFAFWSTQTPREINENVRPEAMEKNVFGRCRNPHCVVWLNVAPDLDVLATTLPGPNAAGSRVTLTSLPIEITMTIIELLMSPNERMKGLGLIRGLVVSAHLTREINLSHSRFRSVNRELRHVADTILFARLALGAMSLSQVQHHLSLVQNPFSSRLRNYTTTVSLSLVFGPSFHAWVDEATVRLECSQKDEATASVLRLLTNLSQIELTFLPFNTPRRRETWQWWPRTIAALEEVGSSADGTSRPFIRSLALHAIRPSMDHLLGRVLKALVPNLNVLVLATDSNYTYTANGADFVASWTSIQLYATALTTLIVSGVPVTAPIGLWAFLPSLRSLDITSAPALTPGLAYRLICQFPALRNVTLRSIRLRFGSTLPPRDNPDVSPRIELPTGVIDTPTSAPESSSSVDPSITRPRNSISLHSLSLCSLDIDFVAALSALGTSTLHLQVIHRSTTLLHLLKQSSAFVGLSRLVVENEEGMAGGIFGWLGARETEELKAVCKERGCTFEDERFSKTR